MVCNVFYAFNNYAPGVEIQQKKFRVHKNYSGAFNRIRFILRSVYNQYGHFFPGWYGTHLSRRWTIRHLSLFRLLMQDIVEPGKSDRAVIPHQLSQVNAHCFTISFNFIHSP